MAENDIRGQVFTDYPSRWIRSQLVKNPLDGSPHSISGFFRIVRKSCRLTDKRIVSQKLLQIVQLINLLSTGGALAEFGNAVSHGYHIVIIHYGIAKALNAIAQHVAGYEPLTVQN